MHIRGGSRSELRWLFMRIAAALIVAMLTSFATAQAGKWPDVSLYGRIVNALHHGVPAAEVWVTDQNDKKVARTFADGDGYYQLRRLPTGALRLHASGDRMVTASMAVKEGGFVREATLTLQDGDPLEGIVLLADGSPAVGADVIVYDQQPLPAPFQWRGETKTDASGAWRFESAPLRKLRIRAYVSGFRLGTEQINREQRKAIKVTIPNEPTRNRIVKVTDIPDGVTASVTCISGGITAQNAGLLPRGARIIPVTKDGTANVPMLGIHYEVRVTAPGHRSMPLAIPCSVGKDRNLRFRLSPVPKAVREPNTTIRGKLLDPLGTALANVTIVATEHELRATPAITDADGNFVIDVPASENVLYQIGLLSDKWRLGDTRCKIGLDGITWQSKSAQAGKPIRLHATPAGNMRGTLIGPNGTPLAAAQVELIGTSKKLPMRIISATDSAGRIHLQGIPLGPYKLTATTAGGHVGRSTFKVFGNVEGSPGKLKFLQGGELRGQVTDDSGKPVASLRVQVMPADPRMPPQLIRQMGFRLSHGRHALTDRNGNYRLPMVADGDWIAFLASMSNKPRNQIMQPFTIDKEKVKLDLIQK